MNANQQHTTATLWIEDLQENPRFYLIPNRAVVMVGEYQVIDPEGVKKYVDQAQVAQYECTKEEAHNLLKQQWQSALEQAKHAWKRLSLFSETMGLGIDKESIKDGFLDGLKSSGAEVEQAFDFGKNLVEEFQQVVKEGQKGDEKEQQAAFKKVLGSLPEILSFFDEQHLEEASKNPEAWGNALYQKAFGEQEKKKVEKRKAQLAKEVRESIAQGLRNAGITPAEDFKKKNQ